MKQLKTIVFFCLFAGLMSSAWALDEAEEKTTKDEQTQEDKAKQLLQEKSEQAKASFFGYVNPNPPMEGLERKRGLSQKDIDKKKEGSFFTGLPLVNYDPNTGVGYGARIFYFNNGKKTDPLFGYSPYRQQLFAQYFATTKGWQYHTVDYDAPYFMGTLFRLRSNFIYDRNTNAQYYQRGSASLNKLNFKGKDYTTHADYNEAIGVIDNQGDTNAFRNKYDYERPSFNLSLERDMLGGILRPLVGFQLNKYTIRDFTGKEVQGVKNEVTGKEKGIQQATQLSSDCTSGVTKGCNGGWVNLVKVGVAFDTRDYEPDPNSGIFWDVTLETAGAGTGSEYTFTRVSTSPRIYYSPIPQWADLVIAARGMFSHMEGDQPFFVQNTLGLTNGNQSGLGGLRTIRGYKQDRFVGPTMVLANLEIRWTFFDFAVAGQRFALILAPFIDLGRPFDNPEQMSFTNWRYAGGAGFRIAWNQATIIMVDYGKSEEDSGLYINFNHIF